MPRLPGLTAALLLILALACGACATPPREQATEGPLVILVSIDGFHPDYLERGVTPALNALRAEGAFGVMRPSFPTVTFPNHYTLATGLHPDRHGLVSNTMEDDGLGRFALNRRDAVGDRRWWDGGEPIWVTAERAGLRTGTMFWPGSEAPVMGVRPTHWALFDQATPSDARVDRVLGWLDLPVAGRPAFATLYFDIVDTVGHNHGPDSPRTTEAVAEADAAVARLIAGLEARGLAGRAVLLVVSDHGMAATHPDRLIHLDDLIDLEAVQVVHAGAFAGLRPRPGREAEVEAALARRHAHMECWRKADIPARLAYGRHPRVAPIVCMPDVGWLVTTRNWSAPVPRGAHGYDNAAPEMAALFIARGPGIRAGVVLEGLESVDVQPLAAHLLGIAAPAGDGTLERARPALAEP